MREAPTGSRSEICYTNAAVEFEVRRRDRPVLFLTGLVPFSSFLFLLLALCAMSSYIQHNAVVQQDLERQPTNTTGLPAQLSSERAEHIRNLANMMMMGTMDTRGMMNRIFNESGKVVQLVQPFSCYVVLTLLYKRVV